MQQWWFDDGLGLKSVIYVGFLYYFPLIFKVFINIHEYANDANSVICISGHGIKGICITFYLVPRLVVYDKYQLRYD